MYSQLELLDMSRCNVSDLDTDGARSLWALAHNLRILRLADNPLASVPPQLAERLPALQELDLSACLLAAPPALRLAPAQRLRLLQLARNLLETPAGALQEASAGGGVALLDLSGNPLRSKWGTGAFAPLGAGASVNLSRTQLTTLSPSMLRSLQPLRMVDLGGNPFDCGNCSILHLQEWLKNESDPLAPEVLSLGQRVPLDCELPPPQRGRPVQEVEGPSPALCSSASDGWKLASMAGVVGAVLLLVAAILILIAFRFRLHLTYVLHILRAKRTLKEGSKELKMQYDFDAFVCYSKHDRPWVVGELLPRLEGDHPYYRLCLHERNFPLGALVMQNIVECMARSRHTLIILTPFFVESQWCQLELEMAAHRLLEGAERDFLVLMELQPLEAQALPRLLAETHTFLQWPSAEGPGGEGAEEAAWKRLRTALGPPLGCPASSQSDISKDVVVRQSLSLPTKNTLYTRQ